MWSSSPHFSDVAEYESVAELSLKQVANMYLPTFKIQQIHNSTILSWI
jgi:hypothetical protein